MKHSHPRAGLTLTESVVVLLVLAILAGLAIPRITNRMAISRDTRRLQDIQSIREALDQYFLDKGVYPPPSSNANYGGWDVSNDGDFIPELTKKGYLKEVPSDPINDSTYQYRYYVYAQGAYGCRGKNAYYVLGMTKFETQEVSEKNKGYFKCSQRDWNSEFDYVTGGGASRE